MEAKLQPSITGTKVNLIKGASQNDLNNATILAKQYRDEAEVFKNDTSILKDDTIVLHDNVVYKESLVSPHYNNIDIAANNISSINIVSSNIDHIITSNSNIDNINIVANNIADVNTVVTNIVDIQNAEENANIATTKAQEASDSKDLAYKWANELEDVIVESGKYSAYHWAMKAEEAIIGSLEAQDISYDNTISGLTSTNVKLALDEIDSKTDSHILNTNNPHSVTKTQVGLSNADNTSDINKPISTATQTALNDKAPLANPQFTNHISIGNTTLSNWSSLKVLESSGGVFFGGNGISALTGSNAYYDGTWKYKGAGSAGLQLVNQGSHQFRVASAGVSDGTITWTTTANIDATGVNAVAGTVSLPTYSFLGNTSTGMYLPATNNLAFTTNGVERIRIDTNGNVGIGGTPSAFGGYTTVSLDNASSGGIYNIKVNGTETARLQAYSGAFNVAAKGASTNLTFETNGAERMRLDTNGNVGIGVTPSAWGSSYKVLEIKNNGVGISTSGGAQLLLSTNAYDTGAGTWKYGSANSNATLYSCYQGSHSWLVAPSGTSGNAITWTEAMILDNSGTSLVTLNNGTDTIIRLGYKVGIDRNINIRGNTGTNTSLTFTESGVSDRYTVGCMSGDGSLYFKTGASLATGTTRMTLDASGKLLLTSGTGGLGYGIGAGGAVTQLTSKSTAVTLNKPCGQITMNNAALAANTEINFVVNNSLVSLTDSIYPTIPLNSPNNGSYTVKAIQGTSGFYLYVKNISGGSLSDAVTIDFKVIKGAIS